MRRYMAGAVQTCHEKMLAEAGKDDAWLRIPQRVRETTLQLQLENGSRIIGLPSSSETIIGFSGVKLLIIDEAARVPDLLLQDRAAQISGARRRR